MREFDDIDVMIENVKDPKKRPKTYVVMILDRSGSMEMMRKEAIDVYNEQIKTVKEMTDDHEVYMSLITFSTVVDGAVIWNEGVENLKEKLDESSYVPDGLTALMDALGTTITRLDEEVKVKEDDDTSFLIITISDGQENNSKIWNTGTKLADKIKELTDRGMWTFTYLGTNQDVALAGRNLNIPIMNTQFYDNSAKGMSDGGRLSSVATVAYFSSRSAGERASDSFYSRTGDEDEDKDVATMRAVYDALVDKNDKNEPDTGGEWKS